MRKVLVLGGTGYIGRKMPINFLDFQFECKSEKDLSELSSLDYKYVINLASSKSNSKKEDSLNANYTYPKKISDKLSDSGVKWIQASSYYELQIESGRTDHYTIHKAEFRNYLEEKTRENASFKFTSLFLPHIFGEDEKTSRIIPTISRLCRGEKVSFGHQFLEIPLLHVNDAVTAILVSLTLESSESSYLATPIYKGILKELLHSLKISKDLLENASFNTKLEAWERKKILYPEDLPGFEPKFVFNDLIDYVKKGS